MSTKVYQSTVGITSPAVSAGSPKVTMFGAKSGFVIPKNKLSGSMVPIFRGSKKRTDSVTKESAKQVQRKTKWGPDLSQDAAVRKGRALAYQTRVDQITQQLKSGILEIGDDNGSTLAAQVPDQETPGHQINSEKHKLLELEKREIIGEILQLDQCYKVPLDYKPILKVARVPIPIKENPGYDFIGLVFGSGSDTVKRLEKETGAKVQVFGTKAITREKGEITPSDASKHPDAYEELHLHVSADTFDKVDAAVTLIELVITPTSVNSSVPTLPTPVSEENAHNQNHSRPALSGQISAQNSGTISFQPHVSPWISMAPSQNPISTGLIPIPIPTQNMNSFNPHRAPSQFVAGGVCPVFPNQSLVPPRLPKMYTPFLGPPPRPVQSNPTLLIPNTSGWSAGPANMNTLTQMPLRPPSNSNVILPPFVFTTPGSTSTSTSITAPRPQHPNSSNFTFQPLLSPPSQTAPPRPHNQSHAIQSQTFRPPILNSGPQQVMQPPFRWPHISIQIGQPQVNPNPNQIHASTRPAFPPFIMRPNIASGHFLPGQSQIRQNYPSMVVPPARPVSRPYNAHQVYDPFSPTSVTGE